MKAKITPVIKRMLINRFTVGSAERLHSFLDRNLLGPKRVKQKTARQLLALRAENDIANQTERSLRTKLAVSTGAHKRKFAALQSRTLRAEQSLRDRQAALTKSNQELKNVRGQILQTKKALQSAKSDLVHAKQGMQTLRNRLLGTQQSLRDKRTTLANTKQSVKTLRGRLLRTEKSLRDINSKVSAMKAENETGLGSHVIKSLLSGASLEKAFLEMLKHNTEGHDRLIVRSVAFQMRDQPETTTLGALLLGTFMYNDQLYQTSLNYFREVDEQTVLEHAAREYFGAWMFLHPEDGRQALLEYAAAQSQEITAERANGLMEVLIKYGFYDDARHLIKTISSLIAPPADTDTKIIRQIEWVRARFTTTKHVPPSLADSQINLAIMDYKLLDRSRTSSNRGDHVQTLASLANICRFQNVKFAGDDPLSRQLEILKNDVHPDRRLDGPDATVVPVAMDRDYASGRTYLPNTWLICNGWFMHRSFRGVIDFPFPKNINPIFISFHINDPDVLTPDVVDELRKYEPIGCRDWTTVYRLRDFEIKSFFSGCLTTTIGQILPKATNLPDQRLAVVETPVEMADYEDWKIATFSQVGDYVRDLSLTDGIADAKDMLTSYLSYSKIQTSRLHCYLPCRSMGFDVDFQPKNRSDIRFEGLLDLDANAFEAIRTGIETKLEVMLEAIFAGQSQEAVMTLWRDICAPDVAAAELYCNAPLPAIEPVAVDSSLATVHRQLAQPLHKNAVEVAFALDENLTNYLPAVIHSMNEHTSAPINVHLIHRGLNTDYLTTLTKAFPEIAFQFLDFTKVNYGSELRLLSHTTQSTLDRLYLPEVLNGIDKVVYLDIDLLVRADIKEIFDISLTDMVLAGKLGSLPSWQNTVRLMSRASLKLKPQDAWSMRRRMHKHMTIPAKTFNAGVIVMNLELMRKEFFTSKTLYLVSRCYCNDQDALNLWAGGRVKELPAAWNYVVAHDYEADPKLVHWAGTVKPWNQNLPSLWKNEFSSAMDAGWTKMERYGGKQI
ncbi:MAG: glycosyltransferase [Yoonia sp.]|uniref:glycosyltransferase n=1 Tax=Yoonia sp. TaxID=2212373 RepID=UPI0032642A51